MTAEHTSATETDDGPQGLSKRCPDCMSRFIPENQARCFPCAQVTLCGDPNCACAQEMER